MSFGQWFIEMLKNKKHAEFVNNYFFHNFNATRAYMETYGLENERAAAASASQLLRNPNVSQEIQERFEARAMKADEVLDRLSQIARGDIEDYLNEFDGFDLAKARKAKKTHLIKKIKQRTITKIGKGEGEDDTEIHDLEFEMYSAHEALRDLGKYHALFTDKTRAEDWRTDLIALLKKGDVSPETILKSLDPETATALLRDAGVNP